LGWTGRLNKMARRLWFGCAAEEEPHRAEAGSPLPAPPPPVDESCRPASWLVREAFAQGLAGVDLAPEVRARLYPAFHDAVRGVRGSAEEAVLLAHLFSSGWRWPEFDRWAEVFERQRRWPKSWHHYPSLAVSLRPPPRRVSEALPYFGYLELRDLLNARGFGRRPAPIRVEELAQAFVEGISWEEIEPLALEKYHAFVARCHAGREEDLCRLLAQHLRTTLNNLIPYYQGLSIEANGLLRYRLEVVVADGEAQAAEFASRFRSGQTDRLPPWFPGDQSRLQLVRV